MRDSLGEAIINKKWQELNINTNKENKIKLWYIKYYSAKALLCQCEKRQMLAANIKKKNMGLKGSFVDKTPLFPLMAWDRFLVTLAAVLICCYFPPQCCLPPVENWRCRFEARLEPVPLLCLSMSSSIHVLLLCAPPSASEGCPSPPWETKNTHFGIFTTYYNGSVFQIRQYMYLSCRRQLCRLLRGSLLTDVEGFSSSSSSEAGTGQSGILTGVTGFDGFPSLLSYYRES